MERDYFIITVYCLIADLYDSLFAHKPFRQRGFDPALSDAELITMEICSEYFGFYRDEDLYEYFTKPVPVTCGIINIV